MSVSLALLIMSALLGLFWSRRVTRPIEQLSKASKFVGKGEFDITVQRTSRDEIGDLAESFNEMAAELNTREKALKEAQAALVQSEKMAAFGQLGAGIAHEVKNPLAGILGFAQLSLRKVEEDSQIHRNLMIIQRETRRCKTIIENLLKFARQEKVSRNPTEINPVVEDSISIIDHQLGINQVRLEKDLSSGLPPFLGNANQIQQVLMNLMMNSQQAMEGKPGLITITTRRLETGEIEVRVRDDGPGIPEEIQDKLFEPFFTTKATGKGTGLGLSVSYGIIKDHNGDIRVESKPGMGTAFIIILPVNTDEAGVRSEDEQ
jgi:signal transduction histidine kinase